MAKNYRQGVVRRGPFERGGGVSSGAGMFCGKGTAFVGPCGLSQAGLRGGQAAAVAPFRAGHANTRRGSAQSPRLPPRLAHPALPDPTAPAWWHRVCRRREGVAAARCGPRSPGGPYLPLCCCPPSTGAAARSGLWGRAGIGTRGAAPVLRGHRPVACVRVPSPERRHGLGLVATTFEGGESLELTVAKAAQRRNRTDKRLPSSAGSCSGLG